MQPSLAILIDADNITAYDRKFLRQYSIATSEVENAFAGLRCEQLHYRHAEVGDETRIAGIALGIPSLQTTHRDSSCRSSGRSSAQHAALCLVAEQPPAK